MFGRKQKVITPIKVDFQPRRVTFPQRPNPQSATKSNVSMPVSSQLTMMHLGSPRSRITPQFAYDLLMAQMQLQTTESLGTQVATKLFELYKIGIEHYNTRQNAAKERFFKKKLENLTNHPAVLGMLHAQKNNDDTFYKKKQIQRLVELNNKEATESVENMLKKIECAETRNKETIEKNISKQMEEIRKRIERRKIASRPTSTRGDEDQQDIPEKILLKPKNSVSMKGSVSFAEPDLKDGENYDQYFVDKYQDS